VSKGQLHMNDKLQSRVDELEKEVSQLEKHCCTICCDAPVVPYANCSKPGCATQCAKCLLAELEQVPRPKRCRVCQDVLPTAVEIL